MGLLNNYLPDWLPDDPSKNDAARQGLLAFAGSMLNNRGSLLNGVGNGIVAGGNGYQGAMAQQGQQALRDAQLKQVGLENQKLQSGLDEPAQLASILSGGGPISGGAPGGVKPVSALPQIGAAPAQAAPAAPGGPSFNLGYAGGAPQSDPSAPPGAAGPMPSAPQPAAPAPAAAAPAGASGDLYQKYMDFGDRLTMAGKVSAAKPYYDMAEKLKPKYATDFRVAQGPDGKLHNYLLAEDGTFKDVGLGVKPEMVSTDTGGKVVWSDKNTLAPGSTMAKTVTPGEALQSSDQAKARAQQQQHWNAEQAASPDESPMDPLAVRMTAQQYLAGDSGAINNFGRGAQGAANLNAVRLEIAKQANAAGLNGADIAAKMAEFQGLKAGQRTAGTRSASIEIAANEVAQLAPIALEASAKVSRSGLLPFGKAQVMFDSNTNDPNMRQFAMANTALVNAYGQAMARNGTATVSDKDHAREMLSTGFDQASYAAAVAQLQKETRAAQAAPKQVRKDLSDAVSGREAKPVAAVADLPKKATAPAAAYTDADKEARYQAWKRSQK